MECLQLQMYQVTYAGTVTVTVLLGKICSSIATASDVVIVCMHAVYYSSYVILQTPCPPVKWH